MNSSEICEVCDGPLDAAAVENEEAYCASCTDMSKSLCSVANYFELPLSRRPIPNRFSDDGVPGGTVELRPRDPALYHGKAVDRYPEWSETVRSFKALKGIKYFDIDAFYALIEYLLKEKGLKAEEVSRVKLIQINSLIASDIRARAEAVVERVQVVNAAEAAGCRTS